MQQALCKLPGMAKHFNLKIGLSHMNNHEIQWGKYLKENMIVKLENSQEDTSAMCVSYG